MIVSDKHKYVFIEIPHTASTAIRWELAELYDGQKILSRHAPYSEFLKIASPEQKKYFVFAGIRNPLDTAVTLYMKMCTNHNNIYSEERMQQTKRQELLGFLKAKRLKIAQTSEMNYATYFKSIYNLPYTNDVSLSAAHIDFLVRYENLQTDFADALKQIGIEQKRALPSVNTTKQKTLYLDYYTPNIIGRAKRVFGPFMQEWGYEMPPAWGDVSISPFDKGFYRAVNFAKNIYWRYTWSKIEMKNRAPVHAH